MSALKQALPVWQKQIAEEEAEAAAEKAAKEEQKEEKSDISDYGVFVPENSLQENRRLKKKNHNIQFNVPKEEYV